MKRWVLILFFSGSLISYAQQDRRQQMTNYLHEQEQEGFSGSVLVAEKGVIVLETGIGYADRESGRRETAETVFSVGSITKQFTAAAIIRLESEGRLTTGDSLKRYFPSAPEDKRNITIHQLLTHTAGFPDGLGDDYDTLRADAFLALAFQTPLAYTPGSRYRYSNVGYSLLGILVEKISGMGYEKYLHDKLFIPSGMMHTGYLLPDFKKDQLATGYRDGKRWGNAMDHPWLADGPGWHLRANGGILSTVGDLYKWYLALSRHTVLPKAAFEKLVTPYVAEQADQKSFYSYGWVVQPAGTNQLIWHNGGNGVYNAIVSMDLANDRFLVVSSNSNNKISDRISIDLYNILAGENQLRAQEPDYRDNPVTEKILEVMRMQGAEQFSRNSKEILTEAGLDFEDDMPLLGAGEVLEEKQQWKEAIALFEAYIFYFPRIVVAWNRLGKCYAQQGDMQKAKDCWTTSVSLRNVNNPAVTWLKEMK